MRIRYIGAEASTETFGKTFHRSQWVSIAALGPDVQATLSANPQFEAEAAIEGEATAPPGEVEDAEGVPGGEV